MWLLSVGCWLLVLWSSSSSAFYVVPMTSCHTSRTTMLDHDRVLVEKPLHFLSVQEFVFYYGDRDSWWGDCNAQETRIMYHKLLPVYHPVYWSCVEMEHLAYHAFHTRREAKKYARRRSRFYIRWLSVGLDGVRGLWRHKRWRPLGATFHELWKKYKQQFQQQYPFLEQEELDHQVFMHILYKSCQTNPWIDSICSSSWKSACLCFYEICSEDQIFKSLRFKNKI